MAFDLNQFLQENKKFLIGTAVAGALFIAASATIGSLVWDEFHSAKATVSSVVARSGKEVLYSDKNLKEARAQEEALQGAVESIAARLRFVTRPEFQLKDSGGSPANQYLDIVARFRERRLDDARSRGIDIVDHCGVPDRSPTQPEDIRRALRGIDLVDRALECAIRAGVRTIDRIVIQYDSNNAAAASGAILREEIRVDLEMDATSRAFSTFLELTQKPPIGTTPIPMDELSADTREASTGGRVARGESMVRISLKMSALDVASEKE